MLLVALVLIVRRAVAVLANIRHSRCNGVRNRPWRAVLTSVDRNVGQTASSAVARILVVPLLPRPSRSTRLLAAAAAAGASGWDIALAFAAGRSNPKRALFLESDARLTKAFGSKLEGSFGSTVRFGIELNADSASRLFPDQESVHLHHRNCRPYGPTRLAAKAG
jgi:hypothetical protein